MTNDDELMTAEEFFGGMNTDRREEVRSHRPSRTVIDGVFSKAKEKMVMRIYGVSRAKAHKIIAAREGMSCAARGVTTRKE